MINIHCALPCEAKPLIDRYRLKHVQGHPFKLYERDDVRLVISGIGKVATAAAVAFVYAKYGETAHDIWLNVGVCGSDSLPLGQCVLVNKIRENATAQVWYPPQLLDWTGVKAPLCTYDSPVFDYPHQTIVDMEASAFYATATRFITSELVQVIKVVSDNPTHDATNVSEAQVSALVEKNIGTIANAIEQLTAMRETILPDDACENLKQALLSRHRFSVYQQKQLNRQLGRLCLLAPSLVQTGTPLETLNDAKGVLFWIEAKLAEMTVTL